MSRFTLPIRRWLALALVATFFVPFVVTGGVVARQSWRQHGSATAAQRLRQDASRWNDSAWRTGTQAELAAQGVGFVLVEGGHEVYRSPSAAAGTANQWWPGPSQPFQKLLIPGSHPRKIAYIYTDPRWSAGQSWLMYPLVYLSTLLLTLGFIAWFLGRTVLRPLSATSRAARRIAVGDLEIELPPSRVREVAEVGAAFEAMSAALQESLRQQAALEEERRFFVSSIAHDLRTPLFSLRGYLEGIEQGIADTPHKRMHYLEVAQEKAAALERLVSDLFAYSRAEYLEQTLQRERLDLGPLLERVADGLRPLARRKNVKVVLTGLAAGCTVDADGQLLVRVVENLLDNALRHTPSEGRIDVTWQAKADRVTFTIADSGQGIAAGDLSHLFDPLFRADTSRNSETGGAGLGLTIARRILRAHGGDLSAANGPAGGARFTGTLLIATGDQAPTPAAAMAGT
ncbi:MAG: HAMP domain-containing histidine kinase [Chloroflexota bacterium]|nr:HAMP domain-containing histidine kinase [Chloroflexota bacterium]